jgi:hypothetical protein
MGRPRKQPENRKSYHLRVPLDESQRTLIDRAASLAHEDKAEWARKILLDAAQRGIAKESQEMNKSKREHN